MTSSFLYILVRDNYDWEDILIFDDLEEAKKKYIEYVKLLKYIIPKTPFRIEIFEKKNGCFFALNKIVDVDI